LRKEREKRILKTSEALCKRRLSPYAFISASACCLLVVIAFLIAFCGTNIVTPLMLEYFNWGFYWLTAFIPCLVFIFGLVTCIPLHAVTSNYLPFLDICRGVSHEEYRMETDGKMKLKS